MNMSIDCSKHLAHNSILAVCSFRASRARAGNALLILLTASVAINYLDRGALSVAAPLIMRDSTCRRPRWVCCFPRFSGAIPHSNWWQDGLWTGSR